MTSHEHQVGQAGGDLVLGVDERHVGLVLHLSLQSGGGREGEIERNCGDQ